MICAWCGHREESTTEDCPSCGRPIALDGRYLLEEVLGQHGAGATYRAKSTESGETVVVKELLLRRTETLKEIDLFEREASVLEQLDHPAIPKALAHFEVDRGKSVALYNVLELVEGVSLEAELAAHRHTETEVLDILADVLEVLAYLREHDPPIVHRDVKPANLIRRESDGHVSLVDFGASRAVAETLYSTGSTIAGTFGYMAPEQLLGRAEPASDVYALGATAIRLLTGREPHQLFDDNRRFVWRNAATVSGGTAGSIDAMTARKPADRPHDLPDLANAMRRASKGETKALAPHGAPRALVLAGDRPRVDDVLRRLRQQPSWKGVRTRGWVSIGLILGAVFGFAAAVLFPSAVGLFGGLALVCLLSSIIFVPMTLSELWPALRPARLYLRGQMTTGIVTDRFGDLGLKYRFVVDGESYTTSESVTESLFYGAPPGTEVAVFFREDEPTDSTVFLSRTMGR